MSSTRPAFQYFPRDKKLNTREQFELNEYSKNMAAYMIEKQEEHQLSSLVQLVHHEERRYSRFLRTQKRKEKRTVHNNCSPLVPNPFYIGSTALVASVFSSSESSSSGSSSSSTSSSSSPTPSKLVVNPFFDPTYVKNSASQ